MDRLQNEIKKVVFRHCNARPHRLEEERIKFLANFMSRWTGGRDSMKYPQFISAIRSLNVVVNAKEAEEMFNSIDKNGNGNLSIEEFAAKCLGGLSLSEDPESRYIQRAPPVRQSRPAPIKPQRAPNNVLPTTGPAINKVDMKKVNETKNALILPTEDKVDISSMLVDSMRKTIIARGGCDSIAAVGRLFRIMDDDRNRRLDIDEIQTGLADYGLRISKGDIVLLIDAINESPGKGYVRYDELLYALRGELNERRKAMVLKAYAVFDKTGDGIVDFNDIKKHTIPSFHPDVKSGKKSPEQALTTWLAIFEGSVKDGKVTKEEFLHYYSNISASIDNDDYFELMIRNSWHISGGSGQSANTSNLRVLVIFRDGTQDVVELENDIGVDPHDYRTVVGMLRKQGYSNIAKVRTMH